MAIISVYHLRLSDLAAVQLLCANEVPEHLGSIRNQVVDLYKQLTCKKGLRREPEKKGLYWARIGEASKSLYELGWYEHVADVEVRSMNSAIRDTTNIDGFWALANKSNVTVKKVSTRSTAVLDLLVYQGILLLNVTGDLWDIENKSFVSEMKTV